MTDDGLSPQVQAWLASAGSRPNEPGREDRPEDVRARVDALDPPAAEIRAVGLRRREELDSWLRRYAFHPSDAVKAALAVVDAGWKHPDEVAELVAAVRAETAELIRRTIEAAARELNRPHDKDDLDRGRVAGLWDAARIARETR